MFSPLAQLPVKDGDAAELSEVQFTVTPSAVELSASEEERLRTLGLERRSGAPGLYLMRDANGEIELPSEEIKLEGELKVKAERLRDELAAHLKEKGTEGLPKRFGLSPASARCSSPPRCPSATTLATRRTTASSSASTSSRG